MKPPVWARVRKDLRMQPLTEGAIGGDAPFTSSAGCTRPGKSMSPEFQCPVLVTQLGGARVNEGDGGRWRSSTLPSQSILLPPNTPTSWHYSGPVDDVAFYFLDPQSGVQERLGNLATIRGGPIQFADALVAAAAQQLVDELHNGRSADESFMARLAELMLEQVFRVLTASTALPGFTRGTCISHACRRCCATSTHTSPNRCPTTNWPTWRESASRIFAGYSSMRPWTCPRIATSGVAVWRRLASCLSCRTFRSR